MGGPLIAVADPIPERFSRESLAPATCHVEPHRDAAHVVPVGELDIALAPTVDAQLAELYDAGFRRLVVDLRQVSFMDVPGLRVVLNWTDAARAGGATFAVIAGPAHVQRIFTLTATADRVAFLDTATAVRRRFQRQPEPAA